MYEVILGQVSWVGVALTVMAVLLMLVEIHVVGFGVLGLLSAGCFVFGSMFLVFDTAMPLPSSPSAVVSINLVGLVPIIIAAIGFGGWIVSTVLKSGKTTTMPTNDRWIGKKGYAINALNPRGLVLLNSEKWSARSLNNEAIPSGTEIEVTGINGLTLTVKGTTD